MSVNPSTRRAALGAILAAPLTGGAVMALPSDSPQRTAPTVVPDYEARFLALTPSLLTMLVEFDRLWAESRRLFKIAEQAHPRPDPQIFGFDEQMRADRRISVTPEWQAYLAAREPTDELDNRLDEMVAPFMDEPMMSVPAILLKCRIGMSLNQYENDAITDLERLARETLCA